MDGGELLRSLRSVARKELLEILSGRISGRKFLYLDESLNSLVSQTLEVAELRSAGVESWAKLESPEIFRFEDAACNTPVVFLLRANSLSLLECVARHAALIKAETLVVLVHPKGGGYLARTELAEKLNLHVVEICSLCVSVLDRDLADFELNGIFRDFHLFSGTWKLSILADILATNFPQFAKTLSIGSAGKFVAEQLVKQRASPGASDAGPGGTLVLLDRRVDILSVVASQFGYEATIAEILGIKGGHVTSASSGGKTTMRLNSEDEIFREIRGRNFGQISDYFKHKAEQIQTVYKEKERLKEISDLHEYMEKFKVTQNTHALLTAHVNLAKEISSVKNGASEELLEIEDGLISGRLAEVGAARTGRLLERGEKLESVVRLGIIQSLVSGNFFDKLAKVAVLQYFGIEKLPLLENCQQLIDKSHKNVWKIKDLFDLVPENSDPLAEGYAGYVPLTVRLIERLHRWRDETEALNLLHGPVLEISSPTSKSATSESLVVCFLGGATYGEINALRKLGESRKSPITILTTEILTAKSFIDSLAETN